MLDVSFSNCDITTFTSRAHVSQLSQAKQSFPVSFSCVTLPQSGGAARAHDLGDRALVRGVVYETLSPHINVR